jgi:outer membrane protein assembly factor BamA
LWAYDRFQLKDRWKSIFFNDTGTIGLYPVAFVETGFGLNAGARFVHRDLLGHEERLRFRASYGGRLRQHYSAKVSSGHLFGERTQLTVEAAWEIFPKSRFFGIGNRDLIAAPAAPIDAVEQRAAVATRYRHDDATAELTFETRVAHPVIVRLSGAYRHRDFEGDIDAEDDPEITDAYAVESLVGYGDDLDNFYPELELTIDTRETAEFFQSPASPSTGWKLTGFVGYRHGLRDDPSAHLRYGIDLQRYINIYGGDRVLFLRAYVEGITGGLDSASFMDLPQLGGPVFLRGYERDRFRDRIVTLSTVEYNYVVERNFSAYVFADVGRVWRSYDKVGMHGLRVGYGGGLQMHSINSFLARAQIASSVDGGLFFNLSFDPVYDARSREESP